MAALADNILDAIPDPTAIRSRLAQLMREQDLLRSLLRLAERKQSKKPSDGQSYRETAHAK